MPCNIEDNNISPPFIPGVPNPPYGLQVAPIQIPFPGIDLPTGLIQDLQDLVNSLGLVFPSSTFKPTIDNFTKVVFDLISNLLTQISPYLSFYNFIQALLNLIVCIIEVICAIPNPFKMANAISKLFNQCLPAFLRLFPWFALIAMIIALLLLILALIDYLILAISNIINEIIRNIKILSSALSFQDATVTKSAIQKLAELLCLIQNTLAILVALSSLMAIIQSLSLLSGGTICDDNNPDGCCSSDVCPPFIKNSPITGTKGQLIYSSEVRADVNSIFSGLTGLPSGFNASVMNIPPVRSERWQFFDTAIEQVYSFSDIITPINDATFWPEGTVFDASTPIKKVPYTCDIKINFDPAIFHSSDTLGGRDFVIKNCVVVRRPYLGVFNYLDQLQNSNQSGTLNLEGGLVYDNDVPYLIDGVQATLNTFIHRPSSLVLNNITVDDTVVFTNVEFTFNPVYETLMGYQLITAGCLPIVRLEKSIMNSMLVSDDIRSIAAKLPLTPVGEMVKSIGVLPNVQGTQDCIMNALAIFRQDVSLDSAAAFQAASTLCLGDLKNQTLFAVCNAIVIASSQFKSEISINTDIEYINRSIIVSVNLKDSSGTNLGFNIPSSCQSDIAKKIKGEVTLGKISNFSYDGYSSFIAEITSDVSGNGNLSVSVNNKIISEMIAGTPSVINEKSIPYTFIDNITERIIRHDNSDIG